MQREQLGSNDSRQATSAPPAPKQQACRQCRLRKVKCDRNTSGNGCGPCQRLRLACAFPDIVGGGGYDGSSGTDGLTQAGLRRRRTTRACNSCKADKTKCSGAQPCARCQSYGRPCRYPHAARSTAPPSRDRRRYSGDTLTWSESGLSVLESPTATDTASVPLSTRVDGGNTRVDRRIPVPSSSAQRSAIAPSTQATTPGSVTNEGALDRETIRTFLDAFFDGPTDASSLPFLHKATILSHWLDSTLDETLLLAITASGMHLAPELMAESATTAEKLMARVHTTLLRNIGSQSTAQLQTLMLLVRYRFAVGAVTDVWVLLSIAARIAFTRRLNHENQSIDPTEQEGLRRLVWSIFYLDKVLSGGVDDLVVCPQERMHIRLPSSDHAFQYGLPSQAGYLCDGQIPSRSQGIPGRQVDELAGGMDAVSYTIRLQALRERVLCYTQRVLQLGASPVDSEHEAAAIDQALEGFRADLPTVLQLTPRQLATMVHTREATGRRPIRDPALAVAIYQLAARMHKLRHLMSMDSSEPGAAAEHVATLLADALRLTGPVRKKGVVWIDHCLDNAERYIASLKRAQHSQPITRQSSQSREQTPQGPDLSHQALRQNTNNAAVNAGSSFSYSAQAPQASRTGDPAILDGRQRSQDATTSYNISFNDQSFVGTAMWDDVVDYVDLDLVPPSDQNLLAYFSM
ncbi:uncharacterized protein PG998_004517 [Apiospora kogelbergensis]|uniref:uncharacterized protein n=1 Tax=Apiospora kogelbergensis TaxID=1337665 RepID=UPI003130A4CD